MIFRPTVRCTPPSAAELWPCTGHARELCSQLGEEAQCGWQGLALLGLEEWAVSQTVSTSASQLSLSLSLALLPLRHGCLCLFPTLHPAWPSLPSCLCAELSDWGDEEWLSKRIQEYATLRVRAWFSVPNDHTPLVLRLHSCWHLTPLHQCAQLHSLLLLFDSALRSRWFVLRATFSTS